MNNNKRKWAGLLICGMIAAATGRISAADLPAVAATAESPRPTGVSVPVAAPVTVPVTWKLGGFFQFDQSLLSETGNTSDSLFGLKSVRTDLSGTVNDNIGYKIHVEYAGGTLKLLDGYTDIPVLPKWKLRLGKYKAPIGIELLQAPTDITFIDFAYSTYFTPNRDTGAMLYGSLGGWDTQLAVLSGTSDYGSSDKDSDSGRSLVIRTIGKPFADLKGLDVGFAASTERRNGSGSSSQLSTYRGIGRPTLFSYSSGVYANGTFYRLAPQFTYYSGPFGLLGEYVVSGQDISNGSSSATVVHGAWQLQAQYYLTGESASYKYVGPKSAYNPEKDQWGAWQVAARVGQAQFDGAAFSYGSGYKASLETTVGLNWIWSDSTKWLLNAQNVWNTTVAGTTSSVAYVDLRVQVKY